MEPERKIEKLLRAYAKKRRADAGDSMKLHPATRRLLQVEVARQKSKPDDEEASVTLWELFRQRWALFAGFALVIFFGAALFLPALSTSKRKAQRINSVNNLKEIGLAAQIAAGDNHGKLPASLDALTNQLVSEKVLYDPETGKPFVYVAGGKNLDALSSNSVLAYSTADEKDHAVLFADGRVAVVNGTQLSELTNHELTELALAKDSARRQFLETPTAITAASGNAADALDKNSKTEAKSVQSVGAAGQNFQNQGSVAQNSFKNTAVQNKAAVVLANFQVQQNGNAIRVVDADGSVYDGALQSENSSAQNWPVPATALPASTPVEVDRKKITAKQDELQTAQNYFFRVTGTNLTLKQNVVFAGNLLAGFGVNSKVRQAPTGGFGGGQSQSVLTNQLPWSNSRIAGTAVISYTNNFEIDAEPLSP